MERLQKAVPGFDVVAFMASEDPMSVVRGHLKADAVAHLADLAPPLRVDATGLTRSAVYAAFCADWLAAPRDPAAWEHEYGVSLRPCLAHVAPDALVSMLQHALFTEPCSSLSAALRLRLAEDVLAHLDGHAAGAQIVSGMCQQLKELASNQTLLSLSGDHAKRFERAQGDAQALLAVVVDLLLDDQPSPVVSEVIALANRSLAGLPLPLPLLPALVVDLLRGP